MNTVSNFAFPLVCKSTAIRDMLVNRCNKKIETRPIVGGNITSQLFFRKYNKTHMPECPNATIIHQQGLYVGNNPDMTSAEINTIVSIFSKSNQ